MKYLKGLVYLLIAVGLVALFAWIFGKSNAPKYQINADGPAIVKQLRELNRLETAAFSIEKIIDAGTSGGAFKEFLFGDRILLIAHGEVIAGFDLSKLDEAAVNIENGDVLRLQLPAPEILSATLDNNKTRVFDRQLGLLTKGNPNLESQARAAAEAAIRADACAGGILDKAADNVGVTLPQLFEAAGFKSVQVMITLSSACQ